MSKHFEELLEELCKAACNVGYAVAEIDEGCGSIKNVRALEKKRDDLIEDMMIIKKEGR